MHSRSDKRINFILFYFITLSRGPAELCANRYLVFIAKYEFNYYFLDWIISILMIQLIDSIVTVHCAHVPSSKWTKEIIYWVSNLSLLWWLVYELQWTMILSPSSTMLCTKRVKEHIFEINNKTCLILYIL